MHIPYSSSMKWGRKEPENPTELQATRCPWKYSWAVSRKTWWNWEVGVGPEHDDIVSLPADRPQELDVLLNAVPELRPRSRDVPVQSNRIVKDFRGEHDRPGDEHVPPDLHRVRNLIGRVPRIPENPPAQRLLLDVAQDPK